MESAFICDRETFSNIYELEKRRSERDWSSVYLSQIKISSEERKNEDIEMAGDQLINILSSKMRAGDTVCHWDDNKYLMIIYDIAENDIPGVMTRISDEFFQNGNKFDYELKIEYQLLK